MHLLQMRDLVRGEVVQYLRRRENQPPGKGQDAIGRAGAPAALRVGDPDAFRQASERQDMAADRTLEIVSCLAPEPVGHPPRQDPARRAPKAPGRCRAARA